MSEKIPTHTNQNTAADILQNVTERIPTDQLHHGVEALKSFQADLREKIADALPESLPALKLEQGRERVKEGFGRARAMLDTLQSSAAKKSRNAAVSTYEYFKDDEKGTQRIVTAGAIGVLAAAGAVGVYQAKKNKRAKQSEIKSNPSNMTDANAHEEAQTVDMRKNTESDSYNDPQQVTDAHNAPRDGNPTPARPTKPAKTTSRTQVDNVKTLNTEGMEDVDDYDESENEYLTHANPQKVRFSPTKEGKIVSGLRIDGEGEQIDLDEFDPETIRNAIITVVNNGSRTEYQLSDGVLINLTESAWTGKIVGTELKDGNEILHGAVIGKQWGSSEGLHTEGNISSIVFVEKVSDKDEADELEGYDAIGSTSLLTLNSELIKNNHNWVSADVSDVLDGGNAKRKKLIKELSYHTQKPELRNPPKVHKEDSNKSANKAADARVEAEQIRKRRATINVARKVFARLGIETVDFDKDNSANGTATITEPTPAKTTRRKRKSSRSGTKLPKLTALDHGEDEPTTVYSKI